MFDFSARRSRQLDLLATGSRALLGFARERHRIAVGPLRGLRLRKRYDRNRRWSCLARGGVLETIDRVR